MADFNVFAVILQSLSNDERITVWHLGVMFGIIQLAKENSLNGIIHISRSKVMALGHINNIVTYHKCIKELVKFGYINYKPSYHPGVRTIVTILIN